MFFRDQTPTPSTATATPAACADNAGAERSYLDVPFAEKNEAKSLGARWDNAKRMWYAPKNEAALLDRWGLSSRQLTELAGEDRQFGADELCIEFMPRSCGCKKIRYALDRDEVNRVQDLVFGRVNRKCEMCGVQDIDKPFQMHGRWEFDADAGTQKLKRLVAMCQDCFDVTHFGATSYAGRREYAILHWQKVNGRSEVECQSHIDESYAKIKLLNDQEWEQDLSLLTNNGIKCASPQGPPNSGRLRGTGSFGSGNGQWPRKHAPRTVHRSGTVVGRGGSAGNQTDSGGPPTDEPGRSGPEAGRGRSTSSVFAFRGS